MRRSRRKLDRRIAVLPPIGGKAFEALPLRQRVMRELQMIATVALMASAQSVFAKRETRRRQAPNRASATRRRKLYAR
jgi:hypothetical protein